VITFNIAPIRDDRAALGSVNTAPLRVKPLFDPSPFERQPMT